MKSPTYSLRLKIPKPPLLIRRVEGGSMTPALHPDRIVFAFTFFKSLKPGHIIIFNHHGTEKIKRIGKVKEGLVYVKGDNPNLSTDSRHFGWIGVDSIVARVVWPGVKQKNMI